MSADEKLKQLFSDLQKEYDIILDRRKTLTSQASGLLGFAGIITTVLTGVIITLSESKDFHSFPLVASSYYHIFLTFAGIGFFSYIVSVVSALLAFWEPKWLPAPAFPNIENENDALDLIEKYISDPESYPTQMTAKNLYLATRQHRITNNQKYLRLKIGQIALMIGISATSVAGFIVISVVN